MSDEIRAFYGCCLAHGLLSEYEDLLEDSYFPIVIANRIDGDSRTISYLTSADADLAKCVLLSCRKDLTDRVADAVDLADLFAPMMKMFECNERTRLTTAAVWLLRAYLSDRDMDRVLESSISIEVMLGDREASDRIGLSKLMANRCAYSLGKTSKERRDIQEFFQNFYKVRSDIVHSGTFKVSPQEVAIVDRGIALASRILRHELALA